MLKKRKRKRTKIRKGDIFSIPINENEVGFGQIIYMEADCLFLAVFFDYKTSISEKYEITDIINSKIIFMGNTFDSLINDINEWKIIGNSLANIEKYEMPLYRLGHPEREMFIVNYKNQIVRECTETEYYQLNFKGDFAPIYFEEGLKAYFGDSKYDVYYKITVEYFLKGISSINI